MTSDFRALLRSRAARTLVLVIVLLTPLAWFLYLPLNDAPNPTLRILYTIGAIAPLVGIVVAILSYLRYVVRRMRVMLRIDSQVSIKASGVQFPLSELAAAQLYSKNGAHFLALIPAHVSERLTVLTARSGRHGLAGYIVEFPTDPNIASFEVVDVLRDHVPGLEVEKIGTV